MSVLIDTTIWSLALRRRKRDLNAEELRTFFEWEKLVIGGEALLIGPIRQETISGIASTREVRIVKARLSSVDEFLLPSELFLLAGDFFNVCRGAGVGPGAIDMMICAAAYMRDAAIFTRDPDFSFYARHIPVKLHAF